MNDLLDLTEVACNFIQVFAYCVKSVSQAPLHRHRVTHMKTPLKAFLTLQLIGIFLTFPLHAQLRTLQTKDLRLIYYDIGHAYVVSHLARCFHNALRFHRNLFTYTPTEETTVLLQDFGDYGNAGATSVPKNLVSVGISPFNYTYETLPASERMNTYMNHELVHIVALDEASKSDRFWQKLFFGKVVPSNENPVSMLYSFLTTPRRYSPRWYHEGIAVFLETWMAGGLGRAMGFYDEMVFRTMVLDSSYIYDQIGLESEGTTIDFMVKSNSYLYGTRFMNYLSYHYGPEKLIQWVSRNDGSSSYYSSQFSHVYGVSLDDEWSRWIKFEHDIQRANLDSIRLHPVTPYRPVSQEALGSVSRAFYDPSLGKIFAAVNYPGQVAHVAAIDFKNGSIEKIFDVKGAALYYVSAVVYHHSTGSLFFTTDNNKWRDLNVVDVRTGDSKMLIQDVRTGDLAFNPADKSLWGVRHLNGISTLVRIPAPYKEWNQIYSLPYGKDLFDIDISPDGSTLTGALSEVDGTQRLVKMDIGKLLKGDTSFDVLYDFENSSPATFAFTNDGKYLFGSSYFSGVSNIVRYDFEKKKMEWITNCETGLFRPVPISKDSLIAFRYTGKGFIPVVIANKVVEDVSAVKLLGQAVVEKYPVVTTWQLKPPSPATINIDSLTIYSGEYSPFHNMKLTSGYPIVEGYKDYAAFGLRLNFSDAILLYDLEASASYTPNVRLKQNERFHAGFNFRMWRWRLSGAYNTADFYDLFGPTKTSRKGYSLAIQFRDFLVFDEPKTMDYSVTLAGYGGLERLPDFQNVRVSFDKFLTLNGKVNYQYYLKSLGAVDDEKGVRWQIISFNTYVREKIFPRVLANLDYGILLPINHSSIWFRMSAGKSLRGRGDSFANFYFGGFGNNWVDYLSAKRFREYYSFPGVELNEVGGTNYGKLLLEWTLPPVRFRRFGVSSFYCNWTQLTLFSTGLVTNVDSDELRRKLVDIGAQLDFRLVIFSILESTFSLGYAVAFEKDRPPDKTDHWTNEFMISLKLLK